MNKNGILDRQKIFLRSVGSVEMIKMPVIDHARDVSGRARQKYIDHAEKKFVMIEFWWDKTRDNPLVTTT